MSIINSLDKVDKIDTEAGRIGIHRRPLKIKGGASGHGRIRDRVTELNGRGQGSAKGDDRENAHYYRLKRQGTKKRQRKERQCLFKKSVVVLCMNLI